MEAAATTKSEADAHLEVLRRERGIREHDASENSTIVRGYHQALKILSDQLYKASTHFILELIQNADDNSYGDGTVPSLRLMSYSRGNRKYFRTDCNEVGFTFRQLDALMDVGHSTKAGTTDNSKRYIGEKGIGFKSVFKVADVVHVASGLYEFKLDRDALLGMILPIPSRFPAADRVEGHTQFLLELKHRRDYDAIEAELHNIDPDLLLFLRNLDKIRISINGSEKMYHREITKFDPTFKGEVVKISAHSDVTTWKRYVVHRHTVRGLPSEPQREGITSSEVVIAFGVDDKGTPVSTTQRVFAFLPVDDYGFRFLIHADFMLVASREGLDVSSLWNLSLRDATKTAFVEAIRHLVALPPSLKGKGLCYEWPNYIERYPGSSSFWNELHKQMLDSLRHMPLLESRKRGALRKPTSLRYVPEAYRVEGGKTLFELPSIMNSHLSFNYDAVWRKLGVIGVGRLDIKDLCQEFRVWINEVGSDGLKSQPAAWHQKISSIFCGWDFLREKLQDFPIVPVQDGSWVKASQDDLFFASTDTSEHVPTGIQLSLVDRSASDDPERRKFLEFLGIKQYTPDRVCELIVRLHRDLSSGSLDRAEDDIITDTVYLFKHRSNILASPPDIYFAVSKGGDYQLSSRCQLYLIDPAIQPDLITKYQRRTGSPFAVLSEKYETELRKNGTELDVTLFRTWLKQSEHTSFSSMPVLLQDNNLGPGWHFLRRHDVIDLLQAVRLYWANTASPASSITRAVAELPVPCCDGEARVLGLLALPTTVLREKCPHLDFANLPDPRQETWGFLSNMGVLTSCTVTARLRELQKIAQLHMEEVDRNAVYEIYEALNASEEGQHQEIRDAFEKRPLVFVRKPWRRWLSHRQCVWGALNVLKDVTKLRHRYPKCETLFRVTLGIRDAGTSHIVEELCAISGRGNAAAQRFGELFFWLERFRYTKEGLSSRQILRIQEAVIFPVVTAGVTDREQPDVVLLPMSAGDWYVPDRASLERAFRGKVAMLSMPARKVRPLRNLFRDLGFSQFFLSSAVEETIELEGTSIEDLQQEHDLKTRLRYVQLATAVPPLPRKSTLQVWSVPSISTKCRLGDVEMKTEEGLITIKEGEGTTNIYIRDGICAADQYKVNFELIEHFTALLGVEAKHMNLVNLIMNSPIPELPTIMEKHDIDVPGASEDGDADDREIAGEDRSVTIATPATSSRGTMQITEAAVDVENDARSAGVKRKFQAIDLSDGENGATTESVDHPISPPVVPLREIAPSREVNTERIAQQASRFQPSEALVSRVPKRSHHLDDPSQQTPPKPSPSTRPVPAAAAAAASSALGDLTVHSHDSYTEAYPETPEMFPSTTRPLQPTLSQLMGTRETIQRAAPATGESRHREIGFRGEFFVYKMLQNKIDDWSYDNWTSKLRVDAGLPQFHERERDFSDFTYLDRHGHMKRMLSGSGVAVLDGWSRDTKFHFEVKATTGPGSEQFYVSQNQLDKMREYDMDPSNAYILIRVSDLDEDGGPRIRLFRDPWSLYLERGLDFRSDEGYKVYDLS